MLRNRELSLRSPVGWLSTLVLGIGLLWAPTADARPLGPGDPAPSGPGDPPAAGPENPEPQRRGGQGFAFGAPRGWFGFKGGWQIARADSDIFDFNEENLTLTDDDYNSFLFGVEGGWSINSRVDAVFGVSYSRTSPRSEFRDFEDQFGAPITQETVLEQTPLTASLRFYLTPRGRRVGNLAWVPSTVAPYVGAGGGIVYWKYEQFGDFVDFVDFTIFTDHFATDGVTPTVHVLGGVDVSLSPRVNLGFEARYDWAEADLAPAFVGFEPIDLAGLKTTVGVSFRF